MFDKLIAIIQQFGAAALPIFIVDMWEMSIVLRAGNFLKIAKPGLHFKIPFIDSVWKHTIITQSLHIPTQSITTCDNENVVVKGIIRFRIGDIKLFLTTITEPKDVLIDTTAGMIREIIENTDWEDLVEVDEKLTPAVANFVKKWGIEVEKVTLTDLQMANSIRVINDTMFGAHTIPLDQAN
jgi:regulator of protease activity HflC (stomatin/prohibitin superfamily)